LWFKKKIIQWNHNFKQTVEKFKTFSKAVEEIVEFINDINEYLQKENINDLVKFISKKMKSLKDELIKKQKTTYFNKVIKDLLDGFEKTIDFISESNNELTYLHLNKKEIIKSMNFDKLQSELKVTLLKLNDEIEKNTKIEEENIKLNDENIKLNQNFESIIKTLNQLQNDMIIVKKDSKNKSEEIKRLNDDLKDKSEEIKRLNEDSKNQSNEIKKNKKEIKRLNDDLNDKSEEIKRLNNVLNIQKEINTNLQKQINETEKEKLVEENKNLREDYDKILSFLKIK
jgi:chromosome segregation ATPase